MGCLQEETEQQLRVFWNQVDENYFCKDDQKIQRQTSLNELLLKRKEEASATSAHCKREL